MAWGYVKNKNHGTFHRFNYRHQSIFTIVLINRSSIEDAHIWNDQ